MAMDFSGPILNNGGAAEDAIAGSHANKRKRGKIPKKIMKAEREKLKRGQLNDHFNKLASVLDLNEPNNGKASILNETLRLVNDLRLHIQNLRRENATLLSESHYMTAEKNELQDENAACEAQIKKLKSEIEERLGLSKPDLNTTPPDMASQFIEQIPTVNPSTQQPPIMGPLYVLPVGHDFQNFQKPDATRNKPVAVSKPHARYPTQTDSWPLQFLSQQPKATS